MEKQALTGLCRLVKATGYSMAGLRAAWRNEEAFRLDTLLCVVMTPLALWLGENSVERVLMIGSLVLLLITELLNSGVEAVVDRVGSERHELSGRAKDIGSAAVFIALVNIAVVWVILLFDL
jgi:diacylglycerol kinase (ATP)